MTEANLDLAVIGNGRTAALVEPSARIVWWCLPRYDGDPVFCRLLAGDEEKGFTDVVLDGQTSIVAEGLTTALSAPSGTTIAGEAEVAVRVDSGTARVLVMRLLPVPSA